MEEKKTVQRIKRISLQAGILLCLCFFTGCRSGSDTANTIQNCSQRFAAFCRIQENSYFSHQEADGMQYLYYYDEKTNTASPLCGRAECTHNTTACSACIGNALGMQTDGKSIYWISPGYTAEERVNGYSYMLYRVSADGTKRKCLRKLSEVSENLLPTANLMALYDSEHAFICGNKSIITDGEPVITTALYVFWQNNDEMKTLYEETYPAAPVIQIYRNQLYLSLTRQIIAEEGDEVKLSSEFELRRYNMDTWEEEILFRDKLDFVPYNFYVLEDRILISPVSAGNNQLYAYIFEKQTIEPMLCFDENDEYDTVFLDNNIIIGYTYPDFPDFSMKKLKVTDYTGKVLLEVESEEHMRSDDGSHVFGRTYYGSDETGLYFSYVDTESDPASLTQRIVRYSLMDGVETELIGK